MATTKKESGFKRERLGSPVIKVIQAAAQKVKDDLFGLLAVFAVLVTGIGYLFDHFNLYWYLMTLILIGLAYPRK